MSFIITGGDDGLIRQWNLAEVIGGLDDVNRAIKPLWTVSDHALGVTDLALRSGMYLLSSSMDKTIRIWSLFAHRLLCTISAPSPIHCLALNHAENRCYAGGADGAIYIVDLGAPLESSVLAGKEGASSVSGHSGAVTACCVTGDDSKIVTGGQDGRVLIWDAETMQVLREYKGSNSSSKARTGAKDDGTDKSIVFLCAIPYPTLLFDNENTLYPVRALKKYRISKMDEFEPVLSLDPIEEAADSSRFVGVVQSAEGQEGFSVVEQNSKQESVEELLRQENARLKELGEQWKSIAERAFQQLVTSQSKK